MPASRAGAPAAGGASRGGSSVQLLDDSSTGAPRSPVPHKPARQPSTVSSLTGDSAVGSDDEEGPPQHLGYWGSDWHHELVLKLQIIRDSTAFVTFFILAIVFTGVLVGVSLYDSVTSQPGFAAFSSGIEWVLVGIFTFEVVFKIAAEGNRPLDFFKDYWNVFDFLVVLVQYMPVDAAAVSTVRLIRVVRVLRLVRALPKLRVLVLGLAQALSSIGYIAMLLGLLYYFFAVLAVSLYAKNDPIGMGTLHVAFLSLFQAGTLEDWTDVMYTQIEGCEVYGYSGHQDQCIWSDPQPLLATIFFVSFCVLANLLVLNLFIGVILITMAEAQFKLEEEIRLDLEMKERKLHALRQERSPKKVAETQVRVGLAMRERLSNISELLAEALSSLNDIYAHHTSLESTRLVWTWAASSSATAAAVKNFRLLRQLRQRQLARALAPPDGIIQASELFADSDDEGGFLPRSDDKRPAIPAVRARLRGVAAMTALSQSVRLKGVQLAAGDGGTPAAQVAGGTDLHTIQESTSGGTSPRRGGAMASNPVLGSTTPAAPPPRKHAPPPPARHTPHPAPPAQTHTAADATPPPRAALSDEAVNFDMAVARAAARSLIKPTWFNALNNTARRRSIVGRMGGGVKSLSKVLSSTSLLTAQSGVSLPSASTLGSHASTDAGSPEVGGSRTGSFASSHHGSGYSPARGNGNGAFSTPGHALASLLSEGGGRRHRASLAPPLVVEVTEDQTPSPEVDEAGEGKQGAADPPPDTPPNLPSTPSSTTPTAGTSPTAPAPEVSTRRRSLAAVARFSAVVAAASGVQKLQRSFRASHPRGGGGTPASASGTAAAAAAAAAAGGTLPRPGTELHKVFEGSSPGSDTGSWYSPGGPSGGGGGGGGAPGTGLGRFASSFLGRLGTKSAGPSPPPPNTPSPAAASAAATTYLMTSERAEVLAARAAVSASIESMTPAFQQLGQGLDIVARRMLTRLRRKSVHLSAGSSAKLSRARSKLSAVTRMSLVSRKDSMDSGPLSAARVSTVESLSKRSTGAESPTSQDTGGNGSVSKASTPGHSSATGLDAVSEGVEAPPPHLGLGGGTGRTLSVSEVPPTAALGHPPRHSPGDGPAARYQRLSRSVLVTAAARERILAAAGGGGGEGEEPPPSPVAARGASGLLTSSFSTGSGTGAGSGASRGPGGSVGPAARAVGVMPLRSRTHDDGIEAELSAPVLSPTSVNLARVTTLMTALDKISATNQALAQAATPRREDSPRSDA